MNKVGKVWVMSETSEGYAALCAMGHALGECVEAVWIGGQESAQAIRDKGADSVLLAVQPEGCLLEECVDTVVHAACEERPDAILLTTSKRMRLVAARIAASAHTRVINDATRVWLDDRDVLLAEHMVFGGSACSVERATSGVSAVVLVSEGLLLSEPLEAEGGQVATLTELSPSVSASGLRLLDKKVRSVESVNLVAAHRVVSVGRGIEKAEDLQIISGLAEALEAEVGCTRPIAEGSNWMSRERYIGVSGAMLKPDLFVAVGLSGQVQHMVGANSAKTIVAINKDKNAPVFRQADYGIVGDLYEVVPKLTAELKA